MLANVPLKRLALLFPFVLGHTVSAFDFTYDAPTQCDNLNITWSGGQAPYQLFIIPLYNELTNISIPDSAYSDSTGTGIYQTILALPVGQKFLLSMGDANGFGTGGTSDILTTGSSISNTSCNTSSTPVDFFFELNTALQQCRTYTFSNYTGADQPVTIRGLIPLGETFVLQPPVGPTSYDWIANIASGTSLIFTMSDSKGRSGGSSDIEFVGNSSDSSCLNASSPSSTANAASQVATATTTVHVSTVRGIPPGAVAGAVVGSVLFVVAIVLLLIYVLRRKRKVEKSTSDLAPVHIGQRRNTMMSSRRRRVQSVDLLHRPPLPSGPPSSSTLPPRDEYEPNPFIMPSEASVLDGHSTSGHSRGHSPSEVGDDPIIPGSRQSRRASLPLSVSSEAARRKTAMAGVTAYPTPRLILHTDAEDRSIDREGTIELPPQYTDRSTPSFPEAQSPPQAPHVQALGARTID